MPVKSHDTQFSRVRFFSFKKRKKTNKIQKVRWLEPEGAVAQFPPQILPASWNNPMEKLTHSPSLSITPAELTAADAPANVSSFFPTRKSPSECKHRSHQLGSRRHTQPASCFALPFPPRGTFTTGSIASIQTTGGHDKPSSPSH